MSVGVPVKLFHEAENHVVTIETKSGELYRGYLTHAEDTMNCRLDNVTMTAKDGKVSILEQVYIRGSQVRFIIVPDMFKNAPMFTRIKAQAKGRNSAGMRTKANKARTQLLQAAAARGQFQK